jgi:hypothetical protein
MQERFPDPANVFHTNRKSGIGAIHGSEQIFDVAVAYHQA